MKVRFGYWPCTWSLKTTQVRVRPLRTLLDTCNTVNSHPRAHGGWLYPPLREVGIPERAGTAAPAMPVASFGMPATHALILADQVSGEGFADFVIALIGFLEGLRLTREGWSHFYRAPIERHRITDLVCDRMEVAEALRVATAWWYGASEEARQRMFGALHWHVFASGYIHLFDEFAARYAVLDTLARVFHLTTGRREPGHAHRASVLASYYRLVVPSWAAVNGGSSEIADLRHELVHEARFAGAPIGFAFPTHAPNICLQIKDFCSRLIVATLGIPCRYTSTSSDTAQMHALDVAGPLPAA